MTTTLADERAEYEYLQTPRAIRERCEAIFERARASELEHFLLHESRLAYVAARVLAITRHGEPVMIPTGHEVLRDGDVLAIAGSHEAITAAVNLLRTERSPTGER